MTIWHDIQREFREGNNLIKIIFLNIAVFLVLNILQVFSWIITGQQESGIYSFIIENIQTYISLPKLATKPWTLITYMFTHVDLLHILFNMLWLYWMGRIFIDMLNGKRFVAIYILGGLTGALFTIAAYYIIPHLSEQVPAEIPMIGASASVLAIMAATATYFPNYIVQLIFIGPVRIKYIVLGLIILDIILIPGINSGGHIAHLGGALFGYLWASNIKKGTDISKWFMNIMDSISTWTKPRKNIKVTYTNSTQTAKPTNSVTQQEIDIILDKIAKNGYESLSAKEKEILFTMSKKR
ncbi:MAG TPA: rhomboid family intramembrane serine protease [Bacteroidales bacterium]|nr:MAG: Rhomboid protease AarA [Bacteroidetes bacterium ADurb.Bin217]HPM13638.1 rhomboid family intramembrane serine protease [Bacteroidales bacterium]